MTNQSLLPISAMQPLFKFEHDGRIYKIGLFPLNNPAHPNIYFPAMIRKLADYQWETVMQYDTLWVDITREIDEDYMAKSILTKFDSFFPKLPYVEQLNKNIVEGASFENGHLKYRGRSL
jgi:alcohol dehydrogenase YqhD (iron-dependent ADH family)